MATSRSTTTTSTDVKAYPNPFFDLSKNYMPKEIKTLFSYCRTFFYTNEVISNLVRKLTEYPVTDLLYEDLKTTQQAETYKNFFDNRLRLKEFLISVGLDYFTYGNCFVISHKKFKRFLKDPETGKLYNISTTSYKYKKGKFICKVPNDNGVVREINMKIEDVPVQNVAGLRFVKLNPENIEIEYDEFSGECDYYYQIPTAKRRKIAAGNKKLLETEPLLVIEAVQKKKKIKLDNSNLYHFKAPTLAEDSQGWGKPIILPAMKKLYYAATLMRGNEAIAQEHIVPKKVVFPSAGGGFDLHQMSMGNWAGKAKDSFEKWKTDPNHIAIMPIPMGYQELSGSGRNLLLTGELKFIEETIITSLGVPIEFIKGGANWTGSSVSLRIIENHFLNYRARLEDILNRFIVPKVAEVSGMPKARLKFTRMRMNDDSETKQMAINLNQLNKLSTKTLLDEIGYDSKREFALLDDEATLRRDLAVKDALAQADAQGQGQLILARAAARSEMVAKEEMAREEELMFKEELEKELGVGEDSVHDQIKKIAASITMLGDETQQTKALESLAKTHPLAAGMVQARLGQMRAEAEMQIAELMAQAPQEETGPAPVRTRNEDKSGPKRDASNGKQKV